eukprot:Gb_20552 [translate_table: standard]
MGEEWYWLAGMRIGGLACRGRVQASLCVAEEEGHALVSRAGGDLNPGGSLDMRSRVQIDGQSGDKGVPSIACRGGQGSRGRDAIGLQYPPLKPRKASCETNARRDSLEMGATSFSSLDMNWRHRVRRKYEYWTPDFPWDTLKNFREELEFEEKWNYKERKALELEYYKNIEEEAWEVEDDDSKSEIVNVE